MPYHSTLVCKLVVVHTRMTQIQVMLIVKKWQGMCEPTDDFSRTKCYGTKTFPNFVHLNRGRRRIFVVVNTSIPVHVGISAEWVRNCRFNSVLMAFTMFRSPTPVELETDIVTTPSRIFVERPFLSAAFLRSSFP